MRFYPSSIIPAALVAAAALAIAGCGGGSSSHSSAVPAPAMTGAKTAAKANVTFTLTIPNRTATMARKSPQYVSSSVQSGVIIANPGNSQTEVNLAAGSPLCAATASGRTCTLSATAPIGSDTFTVLLYDGSFTAGAHSGTAVSAGTTLATTIAEGAANTTLPLVLGGVLDHATSTIVQPTPYQFTGTSGQIVVTGYDHGNNIIIAPGAFANCCGSGATISVSALGNGYTLSLNGAAATSSVTVTSPSDAITIAQSDARTGSRVGFFVSNAAPVTGDMNIAPQYSTSNTTVTVPTMLVTPGPMQGANGVIAGVDGTGFDLFFYGGSGAKQSCSTSGASDAAPSSGNSVFFIFGGSAWKTATSTSPVACSLSVQLSTVSTITTTNLSDVWGIVPGTLSSACTAEVAGGPSGSWTLNGTSCTAPQNLTQDFNGSGGFAFTFTSSSGPEVGYFSTALNPGTHTSVATAGNAIGLGAYGGFLYVVETQSNSVLVFSVPGLFQVANFPLPTTYTTGCLLNNARQFAVGDDGHGYLALGGIGCNHDGVLEFALPSGTLLNYFSTLAGVYSVTSDRNGHMYWSDANGELILFPSATP